MADKITYSLSVTPIETVTQAVTYSNIEDAANHATVTNNSHDVLATEVGTSLGGSGEATCGGYAASAADQGYLNQTVNYANAVDDSWTALGSESSATFVFVKNTGKLFSSVTALGDNAAATGDHVAVAVNNGAILISFLGPGECICLKALNATQTLDASDIKVKSFEDDGTAAAGTDHLAVEYLVVD
jgi:hypothetical protein